MGSLAMVVVLIVLPVVTELVKVAAKRWGWFEASKLGPPIAGAVSLAVYTIAWAIASRELGELGSYTQEALAVAFGAVTIKTSMEKWAPGTDERIREATGAVKLSGADKE